MTRIGNQFPTRSFILPYEDSLYQNAIDFYEESGREAQEWQEVLIKHIMAVNDDGLWTHTKFGYSIPRRNGKNEIVAIRELYALENGEVCLHTAHRTNTSHAAWERLKRILEKSGYAEGEDFISLKAKGNERLELLSTGGRVEFRTRTSTGGLGEGFDLLIIDEAQEYTEDQESALKYTVTDSKNPQTLFCGTPPTLVSSGTVFMKMRDKILAGLTKNAAWAEWGVDEESDPHDKELWYQCNPSLGTIFTERSVEDEIGDDVIDFNIQRLGLWIKYNQKSEISKADWDKLKALTLPRFVGKLHVGIKYGQNGKNVALAVAVKTLSKKIFVECIDCRSVRQGNLWIIDFLKNIDFDRVVIDGASGQSILAGHMKDFNIKAPMLPTVKEIITANSTWEQGIYSQNILHMDQPSLTETATNCVKRNIGSGGGFGYKSLYDDNDISVMDSCILAYWSCAGEKPKKKQKTYY
ncbi:phage terminase [Peptostreptococcus anaerobius CAG:621]|jgi:phage terminase large subunit-like protein|uniref:terminase large subunit n=1 Tax=Peptostreptococcus anaerobius TaxID=1261 RepID=UPI00033761FF|nr:terminase large subunit [Peptostreptococcus anaerobius]CCY49924.1 phage terminase [Peptostreptococcus anaerobius CAG:621]